MQKNEGSLLLAFVFTKEGVGCQGINIFSRIQYMIIVMLQNAALEVDLEDSADANLQC